MRFSDLIYETFTSIATNKVRSGLTMLGIVIGIASVIVMIGIGRGAQSSIEGEIEKIGSNLLMVMPNKQRGPGQQVSSGNAESLEMEDVEMIEEEVESVKTIAPVVTGSYRFISAGQNTKTSVTGTVPDYTEVKSLEVEEGMFFTEDHVKKLSRVAVLGPDTVEDLFGEDGEAVGKKITIEGVNFTIIGTTVAKGSEGFGSRDDVAYIPITTAQQYLIGSESLSSIDIQIDTQENMSDAEDEIETLLLAKHKIDDPDDADFRIMNQADIIETASSITGTFTVLLGAVAGISLVVGGIGIMNMMLTTVTERTREIGLRKAIGAKGDDITKQFLYESIALTFVGGFIGVLLGYAVSAGVEKFANLASEISTTSILLAFGVSAFIGIVFGYYPAKRAAKLNAIEALRYE